MVCRRHRTVTNPSTAGWYVGTGCGVLHAIDKTTLVYAVEGCSMKKSLVGLALVAAAFDAGAQTLSLLGPDTHRFTGFNASGFAPKSFTSGLFATVWVSGPATVTYDFIGSESGLVCKLPWRRDGAGDREDR
jgi:hypothetical protein